MKLFVVSLFFISAISLAQTDAKSQYKTFLADFEAYRDKPEVASDNSTLKAGPCGQYNLKFMVTGQGDKEMVNMPPARKLCYDLNRFDKAKNPDISKDWEYEIKPVGDRFYTIRAIKNGAEGSQEIYYYERKK